MESGVLVIVEMVFLQDWMRKHGAVMVVTVVTVAQG